MTYEIKDFKDVIKKEMTITQWALSRDTTKQNASSLLQRLLKNFCETEKYKKIENLVDNYRQKNNAIVEISNIKKEDDTALEVFCYLNKNNIFQLSGKVFYSTVSVQEMLSSIKEIIVDTRGKISLKMAFASMKITVPEKFIELLSKDMDFEKILKAKPLEVVLDILKEQKKPISKEKLFNEIAKKGIKLKTVMNIIKNPSNSLNMVLNLGDEVCDKDTFFNHYIDMDFAHKFLLASIAVCEKNDICKTDIKWVKNAVSIQYPDIDINKYSLFELKAILCSEEHFKADIKFNLTYMDKKCQYSPSNTTERVEDILRSNPMPLTFTTLIGELEKNGKSYSKTTLSSHILTNNENLFIKFGEAGWTLKEYENYVSEILEVTNKISIEEILESFFEDFNAVSVKDLALKLEVPQIVFSNFISGLSSVSDFINKLSEYNYRVFVSEDKAKLNIERK